MKRSGTIGIFVATMLVLGIGASSLGARPKKNVRKPAVPNKIEEKIIPLDTLEDGYPNLMDHTFAGPIDEGNLTIKFRKDGVASYVVVDSLKQTYRSLPRWAYQSPGIFIVYVDKDEPMTFFVSRDGQLLKTQKDLNATEFFEFKIVK